jgi:8-oxo-dGTP pyrophosphatase MutT (NUDIX family)
MATGLHEALFPQLCRERSYDAVSTRFEALRAFPPDGAISNIHVVPFTTNGCIVVEFDHGWDVPGGTLEPGESWRDAAARELIEEAGAQLQSLHLLGLLRGHSTAGEPYRPHLPHPDFVVLLGWGDVEIVGAPSQPPDGEHVRRVHELTPGAAAQALRRRGRPDLAELYELATLVRAGAPVFTTRESRAAVSARARCTPRPNA